MQDRLIKKLLPPSFYISLFAHLLLLLGFLIFLFLHEKEAKKPVHDYVPAYVAQHAAMQQMAAYSTKANAKNMPNHTSAARSASSIKKIVSSRQPSVLAMTYAVLQQSQRAWLATSREEQEPIYLIGDLNHPADPLIKLLARALSKNFSYPKVARELGIHGRAIISLRLHPDGHITHIQLLKSAQSEELDAAALYAVNTAPVVYGVDRFLSQPKQFVIGFIFR